MSKKGQVTFGNSPQLIITLVVIAMLAAAGIIGVNSFKTGQNDGDNTSVVNTTVNNVTPAFTNLTSQLGTIGTMLAVGLILLVVLGVFGMRNRGGL
jgi:hypothetical protein